jgi:hypothetical protein
MKKFALVLAALGLSTSVLALESGISETGISYNEVGVGYTSQSANSGDNTGTATGAVIGAQALITKNIFTYGSYSMTSGTFAGGLGNVDSSDSLLGLGLRTAVASNVDVNLTASYLNTKSSFLGTTGYFTGYATGATVRALVAPKLEANVGVSYYDVKNERFGSSSGTQYRIGTGYQFSEKIIGRAGYVTETGADGYTVSVNYLF